MVEITSGEGVAKVDLVSNRSDVNIGKYETGEIDMNDISAFNVGGSSIDRSKPVGSTQQGKMTHELREQYEKGKGGYSGRDGYDYCHGIGILSENSVNGNIRIPRYGNEREGLTRGNRWVNQLYKERNGTVTRLVFSIGSSNMKVEQLKPTGLRR